MRYGRMGAFLALVAMLNACSKGDSERQGGKNVRASPSEPESAPKVLYLPDSDLPGRPASGLDAEAPPPSFMAASRCPGEMVDIAGRFCIDRYEASLVDAKTLRALSPYYHPSLAQTRVSYARWQKRRLSTGPPAAREMPVPAPPEWQLSEPFEPLARSTRTVVPNGYLNREMADRACRNAGKRLCTSEEWVTACRGERDQKYPYGSRYVDGKCNVHRELHPALVLHGDASIGHLDPRLNQVAENGAQLLRVTGATPECRSQWGDDAVYDMVGNLDEWVDDPQGVFLGGFFSRGTREGCDARISAHPPNYFDYSLGVRCCK